MPSGKLATECLKTHSSVVLEHKGITAEKALPKILQLVALNRLQDAFDVAKDCICLQPAARSKTPLERQIWEMLGKAALDQMDLESAEKAYQQIPKADMLLWLNAIRQRSEEKLVAAGNIYIHMDEYDKAEEAFLKSQQPTLALDLLVDLQKWDRALTVAQTLDPTRLAPLNLRYAQDLEADGKYQRALRHYERAREILSKPTDLSGSGRESPKALGESPDERGAPGKEIRSNGDHPSRTSNVLSPERICLAGIARCAIRIGEIQRGMQMAVDLGDKAVLEESASLLERLRQFAEAASLHQKAGNIDKAAALYIEVKTPRHFACGDAHEFVAAAPLMTQIESPKIQLLFAKAKEEQRCFQDAMEAYARAKHYQAVVRIMLQELGREQEAFEIVRTTRSSVAADTAAEFCRKKGCVKEAVEFLVVAGRVQEAVALAEERDEMEPFVQCVGDGMGADVQKRIAVYYEKQNLPLQAARHYANCGNAEKALDLYLHADVPAYDAAIDLVGRFKQVGLIRRLRDLLEGVSDGVPKDPSFLHKLHVALGDHVEAAKGACKVAAKEQGEGHYKAAHDILFRTWKNLAEQQLPVPQQLVTRFTTLHSYILVRRLMRAGDFPVAAYLLERVLQNIHEYVFDFYN
ncbi:wdr19 protein, related [Neospora caninum Liverpool]|uniref:Wdr19 protein, related n=1 Tax=Neospora caninum (strain Liverpool) TaxID=572307 RepID=F0VAK5_NEOCL|nr:wdr19 protein, related [Neospora caninum Liverpool]CBZ50694.1 wdr19 protein, related [Neospora caninum Liverpool]|eukprot:XP_003880727.1 wdr19 protein, related [Neospora caninum Liverpool]